MTIDPLTEDDLLDEITLSLLFEPSIKRSQLKIFQALCRLAIILTDVICIAFPPDIYIPGLSQDGLFKRLAKIKDIKEGLVKWKEDSQVQLASPEISQHGTLDTNARLMMLHYQ